jgi:hypothetical protein
MADVMVRGSLFAAAVVVTACSSGSSGSGSAPSRSAPGRVTTTPATSSSSPAAPSTPGPTPFTSAIYGYTVTLPAEWVSTAATKRWDGDVRHGTAGLSHDAADVDQFIYTTNRTSWGAAAPWTQDLTAYTSALIAANARYHGDTCPAEPQSRSRITIGGSPGVLLAYDCGILINLAGVVHDGIGYRFGFRDLDVQAATDPEDHSTFMAILGSVRFPG